MKDPAKAKAAGLVMPDKAFCGKCHKKGVDDAKKNMFFVPLTDEGTIPHEVIGEFSAGRVLLKPATPGTGVIAGGPIRPLLELAGVKNVLSKSLGTDNAMNIVKAAAEGLQQLSSPCKTFTVFHYGSYKAKFFIQSGLFFSFFFINPVSSNSVFRNFMHVLRSYLNF